MKSSKSKVFKTYQEYSSFYAANPTEKKDTAKNKYYQIGQDVAKMACKKVTNQIKNQIE